MPYRISGLPRAAFAPLFSMSDEQLAAQGARRMISDGQGFPCRISLADAPAGAPVILLNHVSHDVAGPFRTAYAIYVGEQAEAPEPFEGRVPDYLDRRTLSLRAFDEEGMLKTAVLGLPGEADRHFRALFAQADVAEVHAHNAAYGCFLAKAVRA